MGRLLTEDLDLLCGKEHCQALVYHNKEHIQDKGKPQDNGKPQDKVEPKDKGHEGDIQD